MRTLRWLSDVSRVPLLCLALIGRPEPVEAAPRPTSVELLIPEALATTDRHALDDEIHVDGKLRSTVEDVLRRSAEFRRQWRRLTRSRVVVQIRLVSRTAAPDAHALSYITRRADGRVHATIEIPAGTRIPELLGHELEHVIEQLDGAPMHERHALGDPSIRRSPDGFETARAVMTGRMVSAEFLTR